MKDLQNLVDGPGLDDWPVGFKHLKLTATRLGHETGSRMAWKVRCTAENEADLFTEWPADLDTDKLVLLTSIQDAVINDNALEELGYKRQSHKRAAYWPRAVATFVDYPAMMEPVCCLATLLQRY